MRSIVSLLWVVLVSVGGCTSSQTVLARKALAPEYVMAWPAQWPSYLGKRVTLEGTAAEAKLGPLLQGEHGVIWIDGLETWPARIVSGSGPGKRVRVTGIVIQKDDMPVFVRRSGEPSRAGIGVSTEAERQQEQWRYLLQDAIWMVRE